MSIANNAFRRAHQTAAGMSDRRSTSAFAILLMPFVLMACGTEENALPENPGPVDYYLLDPVAIERGRAIYEGSCANFCHGVETDSEAVDLFDCEWRHGSTADDLFEIITRGIADTRMVGFGENFPQGQDDTWRLVAYLLSNQRSCDVNAGTETESDIENL